MIRIFLLLQNTRFKGRTKECLFYLKCYLFSPLPFDLMLWFEGQTTPWECLVFMCISLVWTVLSIDFGMSIVLCVCKRNIRSFGEKCAELFNIPHWFFWSWSLNLFFLFTWYTMLEYGDWGWCGVRVWMKYNRQEY